MNRAAISLLFIFSSSAVYALTPNQWQFRQTIEVQAPGLVQVDLSAETINIARPDLSDVRIVDVGEKELPFLIDQPMPRAESTVRPKDFHAEIISTETRLLITTVTDLIVAGRSMPLLLLAAALCGVAGGLGYRGSLEVINRIAPADQRSEVVSSYLIALFAGNSVPVIGVGVISTYADAITASLIFAAMIAIFAVVAFVFGVKYTR